MEAYIYILLLIVISSTCHGSLRNTANVECARTWDNGRKKCCEGEGPGAEGGSSGRSWSGFCRNGHFDVKFSKRGKVFHTYAYPCSEFRAECQDSGFVESVEETTRRPRSNMGDTMNIKTNLSMYARGGSGGRASKGSGSGGSCPGLEDCVAACPAQVPKVYTVCVANCGRVCGKK